jgi:hypothetical protein
MFFMTKKPIYYPRYALRTSNKPAPAAVPGGEDAA